MPPRLAAVCEQLVTEKCGDNASHVFTTLARHGRLTVPQLNYYTGIRIKRLGTVLRLLIDHNLLLWHQADEYEAVFFQVDWHAAYVMTRQDKIHGLVEERLGKTARSLFSTVLCEGKIGVGELEGRQRFEVGSPRDSGIGMMDDQASEDGAASEYKTTMSDEKFTSPHAFHATLNDLLEHGFLAKVTSRDHVPVAELEEELRNQVIMADPRTFKDGKTTGPKTAVAYVNAANSLKRKWQDESEFSAHRDAASHGKIKTGKRSVSSSNKRRKDNNGDSVQDLQSEDEGDFDVAADDELPIDKLPNDLSLHINYNKCMIALRTTRLKEFAGDYLGTMSAAVYGSLLLVAERKSRSNRNRLRVKQGFDVDDDGEIEDTEDITVTDTEVAGVLDKQLDLMSTIHVNSDAPITSISKGKKRRLEDDDDDEKDAIGDPTSDTEKPTGSSKNKKRRLESDGNKDGTTNDIKQEAESDNEAVDPVVPDIDSAEHRLKRYANIDMHLQLISESRKSFIRRNATKRTSTINFSALSEMVAQAEVDQIVAARGGRIGLRICRILREKGRLQDSQIASFCLQPIKDLRRFLSNLQGYGFLDLQEVPKDNSRQPNRSAYLYHFNEHEIRQKFLQETYHGMNMTMDRLETERVVSKAIIEKAESVDWDLTRLNKTERDLFGRWKATERLLNATMERLDDVVVVLRDFGEADTSLQT